MVFKKICQLHKRIPTESTDPVLDWYGVVGQAVLNWHDVAAFLLSFFPVFQEIWVLAPFCFWRKQSSCSILALGSETPLNPICCFCDSFRENFGHIVLQLLLRVTNALLPYFVLMTLSITLRLVLIVVLCFSHWVVDSWKVVPWLGLHLSKVQTCGDYSQDASQGFLETC